MKKSFEDEVTAIILAGGESSRMGKDKALLTIGNDTLLSRICLVAKECTNRVYVVTPWIEKYQNVLPSNCQLVREKPIMDCRSNTPTIGFAQGLRLVETEWVLLLACDLPRLSSSQVKQWLPALATVLPTEIALLPRNSQGWEPLCGFYRQSCLSLLETYIKDGGRSFQSWLAKYPVKELPLSDRTCLFNCNTPEDWKLFKDG
ncbi:molybdenum cofactor guanylyltransferase [Pleurocapsales cyanobacterium LEGE 10410]|nr:molybdenum cofactor guanylyltransferase [Pleurocapsales cyanobacterium LEGE 10410]